MDDIFKTIKLISSYLPKNKFSSILSQNLNSNHLIKSNEMMASMLISLHNIYFYQEFMSEIRKNIKKGTFATFYKKYINYFN